MLDLLFGLFGALIVLSLMISLKLGRQKPVDEKPFHLVAIDVAAEDPTLAARIEDASVFLAIEYSLERTPNRWRDLQLGDGDADVRDVRLLSSSPGSLPLSISLFSRDPSALDGLRLRPVLRNLARLEDAMGVSLPDLEVRVRVSVKSGNVLCDPDPIILFVHTLLADAGSATDSANGARLLPLDDKSVCATDDGEDSASKVTFSRGHIELSP